MNEHLLQLILEWKMPQDEAFAFRLAIIYIELSRKYFPDYKHPTFPKKGDPRKCELFKYCWKLMNSTQDKIKPEDYRYYIQSQMSLLKNIKLSEGCPYIHPNCLVGEQAWKRWMVWQKYFNEVKKSADTSIRPATDYTKEIKKALQDDHFALISRFGELSKHKVLEEMKFILRLQRMSVISAYFLVLSPTANAYINQHKDKIDFDTSLYAERITDEIRAFYKKLFKEV